MAGSLNRVDIIGNLGRDPEVRTMPNGEKVCNLAVATSESWTDRNSGERKERTEWHRVSVFSERLVDVAEKYLKKGSKLYLSGQLQTRKYTGNDGVERYQTEVVLNKFRGELTLLDSRNGDTQREEAPQREAPTRVSGAAAGGGSRAKTSSIDDDSIPFSPCWQ